MNSIADKLAKIAENVPKVYDAGMADYHRRALRGELNEIIIPKDVTTVSGVVASPNATVVRLEADNLESGSILPELYGKTDGFTLIVGKNVKTIPAQFCYSSTGASNLASIIFEDGCICGNVGRRAFEGSHAISGTLFVKGQDLNVGYSAFGACRAIDKIKIKGAKTIGDYAFQSGGAVRKIIFIDMPDSISDTSFAGCGEYRLNGGAWLTETVHVYVPWGEDEVENAPWGIKDAIIHYNYPTNIEYSVEVPEGSDYVYMTVEGVGAIPDFASRSEQIWAADRIGVKILIINDGISEIGDRAFAGFSNAVDVTLPTSLKTIGVLAFDGVGSDITNGIYNWRIVRLPEGLETIEKRAFQKTGLKTLTLPSTVKKIEEGIVEYCPYLKTIRFEGTPDAIHAKAFALCESITDIYVPWSEGEFSLTPWGAPNATIHYNSEV